MLPARASLPPALVLFAALASLAGCASYVANPNEGTPASRDAGCPHWVLTDREEFYLGEPYTDLHRTFGPAGELLRVREHVRTGGHGIDRTFREFEYRWSPGSLTVTRVDAPVGATTYTLDGANVVRMVSEDRDYGTVTRSNMRDAAGRVVEHVAERTYAGATTRERCVFRYDGAGRLIESRCDDGTVKTWHWEGGRLVRTERRSSYPGVGVGVFRWDAQGRLVSRFDDDGYGPGRAYETFYVYDAAGALLREESSNASDPERRPRQAFAYDATGRLVRHELFEATRGARSTVWDWERDELGRPSRMLSDGGAVATNYTYETTPGRVVVTREVGTNRNTWSYQCFERPARLLPEEPALDVPVESPIPEVEHYPVHSHDR